MKVNVNSVQLNDTLGVKEGTTWHSELFMSWKSLNESLLQQMFLTGR
jgi:hypothetical protein